MLFTKVNFKPVWLLFRDAGLEWQKDNVAQLGAALAFFTVLSLPPLLVVLIAVTGAIFGEEAVRGQIVLQIQHHVGREAAEVIQTVIQNTTRPEGSLGATIIGVLSLLLGATGLFAQLQESLNAIWQVKAKPTESMVKDIASFLLKRLFSFLMVLGIGLMLLLSFIVDAGLAVAGDLLSRFMPDFYLAIVQISSFSISFLLGTFLIAVIYRVLPDVIISWKDVAFGALMTSVLLTLGKLAISLYLSQASVGSAYGAAGSFMVLLFWVFAATQIFFFGAEMTEVYAKRFGSGIIPNRHADFR